MEIKVGEYQYQIVCKLENGFKSEISFNNYAWAEIYLLNHYGEDKKYFIVKSKIEKIYNGRN